MKYVCELCGTIYDEAEGDIRAGIVPGTVFAELPEEYTCHGCGFHKEAFDPIRVRKPAEPRKRSASE